MKIKKILVSQPKPTTEKSPYFDLAEEFGLKLEFKSFIKVEGVPAKEFRQERINILDYSAIVFTSRMAIDHFFRMCGEMRVAVPDTMKYFCISEAVAFYLQKYIVYRKRKIFYGDKEVKDMTKILLKHKTERFLIPVSDVHKENLITLMDELKLNYTKAVFYRTVAADVAKDIPDVKEYDIIAFYTPVGVRSLLQNYPDFKQENTIIAAFGEATCLAAEEIGLRVDVKAPTPQAPSMTMALEQFIKAYNKENQDKNFALRNAFLAGWGYRNGDEMQEDLRAWAADSPALQDRLEKIGASDQDYVSQDAWKSLVEIARQPKGIRLP